MQCKIDPNPDQAGFEDVLRRNTMSKISILGEFWSFMRVRKKWWLAPIMFVLLMLSLLIVLTEGSALAPFIYTLF